MFFLTVWPWDFMGFLDLKIVVPSHILLENGLGQAMVEFDL